jgi:signal transduction histidine kinase
MNSVLEYFKNCNHSSGIKELAQSTFKYITEQFHIKVTILIQKPEPGALEIFQSNSGEDIDYWISVLQKRDLNLIQQEIKDFHFFYSGLDFKSEIVFIFIVTKSPTEVNNILSAWQFLHSMTKNIALSLNMEVGNHYSNLISQLLHDVQSLMDINKNNTPELLQKIEYQKNVNRNLLFFIRDFDLFKSLIPVNDFIKDALALLNINHQMLNLSIEQQHLIINVDVELFSIAFNEIVKNALSVTKNNFSEISINVSLSNEVSPFLNNKWIVFSISNKGKNIPEDFLPYIFKPFFTTRKHDGYSGFGLANADKIVKAHHGKMEVKSTEGTEFKIYIPYAEL